MKGKEGAQKEKEAELDTPCWMDKQEAEFATNYKEGFDCPDPDYEVWLKSKGPSHTHAAQANGYHIHFYNPKKLAGKIAHSWGKKELLLQQRTRQDNEVTHSCPDHNANKEEVQERYQYLNAQDRKRLKKMKDMVHELKQPNTRYKKNLSETEADHAKNRRLAQEMADLHCSAVHQHLAFLDAALDVLRSAFSPPQ